MERGRLKAAIKAFETIRREAGGDCPDCLLGLAAAHNSSGAHAQAEEAALELIARGPGNALLASAYNQIGFSYYSRQRLPQPWTREALASGRPEYIAAVANLEAAERAFAKAVELDGGRSPTLAQNLGQARGWLAMVSDTPSRSRPATPPTPRAAEAKREENLTAEAEKLMVEANARRVRGDVDGSLPLYEQSIEILMRTGSPARVANVINLMADGLREAGRLEEAVETYRRALKLASADRVTTRNLASSLEQLGRMDEAEDFYRELQESWPGDAIVALQLGNLLLRRGKASDAVAVYRAAMDTSGDPLELVGAGAELQIGPETRAALWGSLGSALITLGETEEALHALRTALQLNPRSSQLRYNLGVVEQRAGNTEAAIAAYEKVIAADAGHAPAHNNLANALRTTGDIDRAIEIYNRALELQPDFALATSNLSSALRAGGDSVAAIDAAREAIRLDPGNAPAWDNLGFALLQSGQYAEAATALERAVALGAADVRVLNNLGYAQRESGETAAAIDTFRRALEQRPSDAVTLSNLGGALRESGQIEAAVDAYRRATEADPSNPVPFNNLALVLRQLGRFEESSRAFARALTLWDG